MLDQDKSEYMKNYMKEYKAKYPEKVRYWQNKSAKRARVYWKDAVIRLYSKGTMKCTRCGFDDIRALSIDHIDGGGTADRKERGRQNSRVYYKELVGEANTNKYQVLCMNCQWIKRFEKNEHN